MILSEEAVKEFQSLYKIRYGIDLSSENAAELGARLIKLYKTVYKEYEVKLVKPSHGS